MELVEQGVAEGVPVNLVESLPDRANEKVIAVDLDLRKVLVLPYRHSSILERAWRALHPSIVIPKRKTELLGKFLGRSASPRDAALSEGPLYVREGNFTAMT
jgi:hypothetical protein